MESKINSLIRENQQLKMQLTQLRNAFDLNREVLFVLSTKAEPTKRHFYIMLKKMNEHIFDLAENQFKTRKERLQKIQQCKILQQRHQNDVMLIESLEHQLETIKKQLNASSFKVEDKPNSVFTPKEIHIILTEEIRKISNELFVLGTKYTKAKQENHRLKKLINNLEDENSESAIGSIKNVDDFANQSPFLKRATLYKQAQQHREKEQQFNNLQYNSEEQDECQEDFTYKQMKNYATTRRNNLTKFKDIKEKSPQPDKQFKELEETNRLLTLRMQNNELQMTELRRQNDQLINRTKLLSSTQIALLKKHGQKDNYNNIDATAIKLIELVQWRLKLKYLDEEEPTTYVFKQGKRSNSL